MGGGHGQEQQAVMAEILFEILAAMVEVLLEILAETTEAGTFFSQ